jgi:hypothetical protein
VPVANDKSYFLPEGRLLLGIFCAEFLSIARFFELFY